jgi:molecular chaperone DnaJ
MLVSVFIWRIAACSSTGIYIGDKFYGRFMLTPFVLSRSFHATGYYTWFTRCSKHKDYYKILGVPKDASQDDIKKAFHSVSIITVQLILRHSKAFS